MSRRQDLQDATGRVEYLAGRGTLQAWGTTAPTNGVTGFAPACIWQNLTGVGGYEWINIGTFSSALWLENDASSSGQQQFGSAVPPGPFNAMRPGGNIYANIGNPIAGNGADTTDDVLGGFVLPANGFDVAGRIINFTAFGKFGATSNNKKIRFWVNPTLSGSTTTAGVVSGGTVTSAGSGVMLFDSTAQTNNATGWMITVTFAKYGVNGSNTQVYTTQPIYGTTHGGVSLPAFATMAENTTMTFVITGSSSTTGAANDVVLNYFEATGND